MKALEIFVKQDEDATLRMYDERAAVISRAVAAFGVTALPRQYNPQALGNVTPIYSWHIDPQLKITGQEVMQALADTRPLGIGSMGADASGMRGRRVQPPKEGDLEQASRSGAGSSAPAAAKPDHDTPNRPARPPRDPQNFGFAVWQIKQGEDRRIADRLIEIFTKARYASPATAA